MMNFCRNPIVDGFVLAGYRLSQLQHGYRWMPDMLIEEIELMESVAPCMHCNVIPEHGWVTHATLNHCDNLEVQHDYLKAYRLSSGTECQLCNISYDSGHERLNHIQMHLNHRWMSYYKLPVYRVGGPMVDSITEEAVKLKSFLHYHFYPKRNVRLFMMIPSWLRGNSIKEKLNSIDQPTYIPISCGPKINMLFNAEIHKQYDAYSTLLYVPALDDKFNGIRHLNRMIGKLMIRLLACLRQKPETMKNIRFQLWKEPVQSLFNSKYLVHVTDEDIKEIMRDVVTKHRTVICPKDLFDDDGCQDAYCMNLVHFFVNFTLYKEATHPLDRQKTLYRHDHVRYGLGKFELIDNPSPGLWLSFADEVIRKKKQELDHPTPYFVYIVLCTDLTNTDDMPTLDNVADFYGGDGNMYNVYVGYSSRSGIPRAHFPQLLNQGNDDIDSDMEEEDVLEGEGRLVGTTELTKAISRGNKALYMLRNYLEETYEDAVKLEAVIQLYKKLSEENAIDNPFKIINKRLEVSALSYLSVAEIEVVFRLVELNVPLLYESPEALENYLRGRNLININWGVIKRPFFMSELERLPL